jgi:tagatose-6-phosphate ketose/aldose isomerase
VDPLSALLELDATEKLDRGLVYTPREIAQQPDTWIETCKALEQQLPALREFLSSAGIGSSDGVRPIVYLIGAGTSDYIGQSLYLLLGSKWQCEVWPVASTSLLTNFADYTLPGRRYLWISFSRSGDSPEGVAVLQRAIAEHPDIRHLLITCNPHGRMNLAVQGRANCFSLTLSDAVNDRSLAMTSSFTNMVLAGQILAHAWSMEEYRPIVHSLAAAGHIFLPKAASLAASLAEEGFVNACFLGSGVLAGAAQESALKLLELTAGQVQTMSQPTLALRHGPMAALHQDTLLVSFVSSQPQRRRYEIDLLNEIGAKGLVSARVAVATENATGLLDCAEHVLTPGMESPIQDAYRPVLDVLLGQLLGLFASIRCGLKPDNPSPSGAISRVVQNIGIY